MPERFAVDSHGPRWTLTFRGSKPIAARDCEQALVQLERDAPVGAEIRCDSASPGKRWAEHLAGRALPSVRDLVLDTHFQSAANQRENSFGDLAATLGAFPSLRRFFATGDLTLSASTHPALEELHLIGDPLSSRVVAALGHSHLPKLTRLVVMLAAESEPADGKKLRRALLSLDAPALREVHLEGVGALPAFLAGLAEDGLPTTWKVLTVSGPADEDELLEVFTGRSGDAFRSLDALGLPIGEQISTSGQEALAARWPGIRDTSLSAALFLPAAYERWGRVSAPVASVAEPEVPRTPEAILSAYDDGCRLARFGLFLPSAATLARVVLGLEAASGACQLAGRALTVAEVKTFLAGVENGQAVALQQAGDLAGALVWVDRSLQNDPRVPGAHHEKACVLALQGAAEAALASVATALSLGIDPEVLTRDSDLASLHGLPRFQELVGKRPS